MVLQAAEAFSSTYQIPFFFFSPSSWFWETEFFHRTQADPKVATQPSRHDLPNSASWCWDYRWMFSSYAFLSNFSLGLLLKILFSSGLGLLYNSVMQQLCNSVIFKIAKDWVLIRAGEAPKSAASFLHQRIATGAECDQRMGTKLGQWTGPGGKNRELEVLQRIDWSKGILMKCLAGDLRMRRLSCLWDTVAGLVRSVSHSCHATQAFGWELDETESSFSSLADLHFSLCKLGSGFVYSWASSLSLPWIGNLLSMLAITSAPGVNLSSFAAWF